MDEKLHLDVGTKLEKCALKVLPELNQQSLDVICKELNSNVEIYRGVLNENVIYCSGEWSGERFKQDFLMTSVLAIREGRQTELWPNLKKTSGDLIVDCIMDMVESAKTSMSPDEVVAKGLVPKVIDVAAATEILHKCYPVKFPMRHKKSEFGLAQLLYEGDLIAVSQLSYSDFIDQMNELAKLLKEILTYRELKIPDNCLLFLLDRILSKVAEDPECLENNKEIEETSEN